MNETDLSLINKFLEREDLDDTQKLIKKQCIQLDQSLANARQELQDLSQQQQQKQNEVVSLTQKLEGALQLVLEIINSKKDLGESDE